MRTNYLRRVCGLLAAILVAGALLPAARAQEGASRAQPARVSFFGMNTYFTGLERNGRDGETGVRTLIAKGREIGTAWAREELSWGNLERDGKGRWRWEPFDSRLRAAAEAGYGIVGMLLTTPAWARVPDCAARASRYAAFGVRSPDYWCPPANPQDYADYVRTVVERYDGDGLADAPGSPRVAAWQLWNEPNAWETWPGSPAEFGAILQAGYAAAKLADPSATVALGGVYVFDGQWKAENGNQDGLRFLGEAFAANPGAWGSFDALAVHPYMPDVAPDQPGLYGKVTMFGRLLTAKAWLEENTRLRGGALRPLWISEVGWSTCSAADSDCYASASLAEAPDGGPPADRMLTLGPSAAAAYQSAEGPGLAAPELDALIGKSEDAQASYLTRAHGIALALGVQHMSWLQLEDKFDGSARNFWEETAIFRTAAAGYAAKPAAFAYATLTRQLGAAAYSGPGPLHTYAHVDNGAAPAARFDLRFRSADRRLIDLIWRNGGAEEVALPIEPGHSVELLSRDGARLPVRIEGGAARFTVGESPVYVVQSIPPGLAVSPGELAAVAAPVDPAQSLVVQVANTGSGTIAWSASEDVAWASVAAGSGQGSAGSVRVTLSPAGLRPGVYRGTLTVSTTIGERAVPLRLVVLEKPYRLYLPRAAR